MAYSVADVVHARLGGRAEAGERVAIIGAGGIGVDVAQYLSAPQPSPTLDAQAWKRHWGVADPADQVDRGVRQRFCCTDDLVAGGVHRHGEAETVRGDTGLCQCGVCQCGADRLVGDQQGVNLLGDAAGCGRA